jgi:hypothetical protein
MIDEDDDLRAVLATLDPKARDTLRRVLIRDQADRDAIASRADAPPGSEWPGLGRHHRLPDDVSEWEAAGRAAARGKIEAGDLWRSGAVIEEHESPGRALPFGAAGRTLDRESWPISPERRSEG